MSSRKPLTILSIAHPAVGKDAGRLRYHALAGRTDIDVHLVVPAVWQEFGRTIVAAPPDEGLNVHVLPIRLPRAGPMSWYLHFYPGLRRLIRAIDPDVVHLWEEPWSVVALQARMLKGRAAMVMEVDQNILKRLPPPFEFIRKHVLAHTDHILSRSPDATAVVRAKGYTGPVTPIGYGVDLRRFSPASKAVSSTPHGAEFWIGYVGRLVDEKGLDDALDAVARASSRISLAIMGEGPHEETLRQRAAALGIVDRVSFRGWGSPDDVASFLRNLDVLVLLTRTTKSVREQFGRVIVEAQACGVPVIGSESGAIPSVVGDGGWIIPESDPATLADLLDRIVANPDIRHAKREAARRNVESRFTYSAVADALISACVVAAGNAEAS